MEEGLQELRPARNPTDVLERAGKLVTASSAAALLLSVCYDFFFLKAVGLDFSEVPTSLADHVRSAIIWAPLLGFVLLGGPLSFIAGAATGRKVAATSGPVAHKRTTDKVVLFVTAILALVVLALAYVSHLRALYFLSFAVIWFAIAVVLHPAISRELGEQFAVFYTTVPVLLGFIAVAGYAQGEVLLRSPKPRWRVELKPADHVVSVDVSGVRRFGSAAVLVGTDGRVVVVPDAQVVSTTKLPVGH